MSHRGGRAEAAATPITITGTGTGPLAHAPPTMVYDSPDDVDALDDLDVLDGQPNGCNQMDVNVLDLNLDLVDHPHLELDLDVNLLASRRPAHDQNADASSIASQNGPHINNSTASAISVDTITSSNTGSALSPVTGGVGTSMRQRGKRRRNASPSAYVMDFDPDTNGLVPGHTAKGAAVGIGLVPGHTAKVNPSCWPLRPRTTPFPGGKSILGVIYVALLWTDMNAATPLGARWRSVMSLAGAYSRATHHRFARPTTKTPIGGARYAPHDVAWADTATTPDNTGNTYVYQWHKPPV